MDVKFLDVFSPLSRHVPSFDPLKDTKPLMFWVLLLKLKKNLVHLSLYYTVEIPTKIEIETNIKQVDKKS